MRLSRLSWLGVDNFLRLFLIYWTYLREWYIFWHDRTWSTFVHEIYRHEKRCRCTDAVCGNFLVLRKCFVKKHQVYTLGRMMTCLQILDIIFLQKDFYVLYYFLCWVFEYKRQITINWLFFLPALCVRAGMHLWKIRVI